MGQYDGTHFPQDSAPGSPVEAEAYARRLALRVAHLLTQPGVREQFIQELEAWSRERLWRRRKYLDIREKYFGVRLALPWRRALLDKQAGPPKGKEGWVYDSCTVRMRNRQGKAHKTSDVHGWCPPILSRGMMPDTLNPFRHFSDYADPWADDSPLSRSEKYAIAAGLHETYLPAVAGSLGELAAYLPSRADFDNLPTRAWPELTLVIENLEAAVEVPAAARSSAPEPPLLADRPVIASDPGASGARPCCPPETTSRSELTENLATHSKDFTFVSWYGTEYTFSCGIQSRVVQVLWEEWERTKLGLHQSTIRESVDAERDNFRVDIAFRGHPAFGTMIKPCGDGRYRLVSPTELAREKPPNPENHD